MSHYDRTGYQIKEREISDRILAEQSRRYIQELQAQLRASIQRGGTFQSPRDLLVARGFLWYYRDDLDRALAEWRKALAMTPEDSLLREQIQAVSRKKTFMERGQTLRELLGQARALSQKGQYEQSLLYWRSLVLMEPDNKDYQKSMLEAQDRVRQTKAEGKLRRARKALQEGHLADASQLFLEVLEVDPANREALENLKRIQQDLSAGEEKPTPITASAPKAAARRPAAKAVSPELSERQYTLGLIYYSQGDVDKARKSLELALKHNPANEKARNALSRIQAELAP